MQHIWIFQLAQALEPSAETKLKGELDELMVGWKAHGSPVPGQAEIRHQRFVIVRAEPGSTSGCSIDSMTHGVEALLGKTGVQVLPASDILYRDKAGNIARIDFREVGKAIGEGKMGPDTLVFDVSLGQTQDLDRFETRLSDSWLKRFLVKASQ